MNEERLGVRLSPDLRALIAQAGSLSVATRALLLLGAHAAGYDVRPLQRELLALALAPLDARAAAATQQLLNTMFNPVLNTEPPVPAETQDVEELAAADPFAAIGIEV